MKADDAKELRKLRKENQRLKKIVADQALDIDMLRELNRENFNPERSPEGRSGPPGALRGDRATGLSGGGPAESHPAPPTPRSFR